MLLNYLNHLISHWLVNFLYKGVPLRFTGPSIYNRKIPAGSSVALSCELNDRKVPVSLWQMNNGRMFTPRKNVVKYGQIFILHWVTKNTEGHYLCRLKRPPFSHNIGWISVTKQTKGKRGNKMLNLHNIRAIMAKIKLPKNPLSMVIFWERERKLNLKLSIFQLKRTFRVSWKHNNTRF